MKNKIVGILIFMLLIGTILPASGINSVKYVTNPMMNGITLYVGGSGLGNFTKIQDAIDNTSDGDTVFVYDDSSPYYENLNINNSIILKGENKDSTIIDGRGEKTIEIFADDVAISNLHLQSYESEPRVNQSYLINIQSNNNLVYDNLITGNTTWGIHIMESDNNNISNNTINGEFKNIVIVIDECDNSTIYKNSITNANIGAGVSIIDSNNSTIIRNDINHCNCSIALGIMTIGSYIYGNSLIYNDFCGIVAVGYTSDTVIIRNNISFNKGIGILYFGITPNDKIIQNNFIGNEMGNAYFIHMLNSVLYFVVFEGIKPFFPKIYWIENYWDESRLRSHLIPGFICLTHRLLFKIGDVIFIEKTISNFYNIDRHPAKEPYEI